MEPGIVGGACGGDCEGVVCEWVCWICWNCGIGGGGGECVDEVVCGEGIIGVVGWGDAGVVGICGGGAVEKNGRGTLFQCEIRLCGHLLLLLLLALFLLYV